MNACLVALAPLAVLLGTRLRWAALGSWLAGLGAAYLAVTMPGHASGTPDDLARWLIALILKFLLAMAIAEAAAAALVHRGGLVRALLGAIAGKAAFLVLLVRWSGRHDVLPFEAMLFLAAMAASGAAGATLAAFTKKSS